MISWDELHRLCELSPESKEKIHKWVIKKTEAANTEEEKNIPTPTQCCCPICGNYHSKES